MDNIISRIREQTSTFIGYPLNAAYDYTDVVKSFATNINNVGCPYTQSTLQIDTKDIERDVLRFFADLWGIDQDQTWGYVTSSGTEGNMQGLYAGREYLGGEPVFYTSKDSHYSIFKIAKLLRLDVRVINTTESGEMDYRDLEAQLDCDRSALINANLGTTMKSAFDDTREIYRILKKHDMHMRYYLHADGALMGFVLPFIECDLFFKKHIHSISISGHKFLGISFPCGVFLMEKRFLTRVSNAIEYIGSVDCTISGSRNGHAPLFFKHIIDVKKMTGFKQDITRCLELAEYLTEQLTGAWRNQNSITVVFPRPSDTVIAKWHLATHGDVSHVIVMPHVTQEMLDAFVKDLKCN